MRLHEQMVLGIQKAAAEVFSTMLGAELGEGVATLEPATPEANDGVVSFIGLAGAWAGTGSLSCSATMACRICSLMLMVDSVAVDEEVLDALAELTNMIIGNVKNELEPELGPLGLSIPTVVFGRNFKTRSTGMADWIVVRFPWEGEHLVAKLCLMPSEKAPHTSATQHGQTCTIDV